MKSTLIAAFVAPSIALTAVGVGSNGDPGQAAYGAAVAVLSAEEARAHASASFARADLDASGALDADEYVSLAIVTAELSRLNGFIALSGHGRDDVVALPIEAAGAISIAERVRVEAVTRGEFYVAAGADALLSGEEYAAAQSARFAAADRNSNGHLARGELVAFAAGEAHLRKPSA